MRPGAPVRQRRCSAAAVAQCAPSSQSARLQWASPSGRLRASVRTELRAADTPPQTPSDASSARLQQDARGKERACGTAEHFSGEHRPAFKWWVGARLVFWGGWGFGLTGWRLGPGLCWNTVCFCVSATTEVWWRINTQSLYTRVYFCTDGVLHLFKTARGFMAQSITLSNVKPIEVSCPGDCFQREKRASQFWGKYDRIFVVWVKMLTGTLFTHRLILHSLSLSLTFRD